MKKYSVSIPWHSFVIVQVEAENEEAAIEKATAEAYPVLCHQCNDELEVGEMNDTLAPEAIEIE